MALIACPDCNTEVSSAAEQCPKCGHPIAPRAVAAAAPARRGVPGWVSATVITLVIFAVVSEYTKPKYQPAAIAQDAAGQGVPAPPVCTVENWTWSNSTHWVTVEGTVVPETVEKVYVQGFDKDGGFLGNGTAYVKPGGSFTALVGKGPNPTNELKIKVSCE